MKTIGLINFKNSKDEEEYNKYKIVRSESLYQEVAKFLIEAEAKGEKTIDFEIVSDWVRYDKALKKVLYIFLSTLEEYFKSIVISNMRFDNEKKVYVKDDHKTIDLETFRNINNYNTFVIGNRQGGIFKYFSCWCKKNDEDNIGGFTSADLDAINSLRNKVMHMSFIALPIFKYNNLRKDLALIKQKLPSPWKDGFVDEIINCQYSGKENREKKLNINKYIIKEI
jgi:hypothetical protein